MALALLGLSKLLGQLVLMKQLESALETQK